jgi:hypothetical protein
MANPPVSVGDNGANVVNTGQGVLLKYFLDALESFQDRIEKAYKEHRYHLRQMNKKAQPVYSSITKSGQVKSDGTLILDFDGPMIGRRWVVRMITISDGGSFWNTMDGSEATVCVGTNMGSIVPSMVRWPFNSLPNSATFGSDQMWIVPRDHVLLSITGGTSGENITSTIWIQDFAEDNGSVAVEE